jgi:serine phosphatase RsbU (regulator of sigma subunit)/tetratricopeptide (TPR) repeat protein
MIENAGKMRDDTVKVNLLNEICDSLYRTNQIATINYGTESLEIARKIKFQKGEAYALKYIGLGYFFQQDNVKAMDYFQESLGIFKSIGNKRGIANMLNSIGVIYNNVESNTKALEYYLQSYQISEEINDSLRIVTSLINIGLIYSKADTTWNKARDYYLRALEMSEKINYRIATGIVFGNLAEILSSQGDFQSALIYYEKSLKIYQSSNPELVPSTLINIGNTYARRSDFQNAIKRQKEAFDIAEKNNWKLDMSQALIGLANTYLQKGETQASLKYFEHAEQIAREIKDLGVRRKIYDGKAKTFAKMSDFARAYRYQLMESALKDTLITENEMYKKDVLQIEKQYEFETKLKEIEIYKRDAKLKDAKSRVLLIILGSLFLGFISISIFMVLLVRANNHKKKANAELAEKNALITSQKQAITDSIHYARRIQYAILPPPEIIDNLLPQNVIVFRPRDIVSGDFYWLSKSHGRIICIAADCTGHGVPGALMSMLGIAFLNEIVSRNPKIKAGEILGELRKYIVKYLHQNQNIGESKDGMDASLLVFDEEMKSVEYAGANNPLIIVRDGILTEYKPDKMPIGIHQNFNQPFTNHEIDLVKGDMLYIFSDGYVDQFGGPDGKKFMIRNLKKLLLEIHSDDMKTQKHSIEGILNTWMGDLDQVDDILLMGIRV